MPTYNDIPLASLVINEVDSQETFEAMKATGLNNNELYLTPEADYYDLAVDERPKENSNNLITSGAVYTALQEVDIEPPTLEELNGIEKPSTAANGQILTYNGSTWVAANAPDTGVTSVNNRSGAVTLTKSDVGLSNVDNVKQYSASNEPPYPVTKVNGKTGDITLSADDIPNVAKTSNKVDVTLDRTKWSNNQYTIQNTYITITSIIEGLPQSKITKEQLEAFGNALVIGGAQSNGSLTLKALGEIPTIDIPITLVIRGDM